MKVDLTYLKNMSAGNKDLIIEMINIFIAQVDEFNNGLDEHYQKNEFEQLGRLAHKAKSSISIMGLKDLALELKKFETLAREGKETETYPAFIENFRIETRVAVEELVEVRKNIDIYI